ncbi:competence type IV pilus minor pilin ComGF [Rummeliibacillus stabekisii]|uniref:competence type IV pilus minor pilin ComGF n=1 Tax=Rummeliibacillus stabekisii TaxID=241244 RepID=UPI0011BF0BEA|nr:competence protein ComGF [Rummeliibacillus stabekisii]
MLQLIILMMFAQFFLLFFVWYGHKKSGILSDSELQYEMFVYQLSKELIHAKEFSLSEKYTALYSSNRGIIGIKSVGSDIRRVGGYQPLLFGLQYAEFEYADSIFETTITFKSGSERRRKFIVPNQE